MGNHFDRELSSSTIDFISFFRLKVSAVSDVASKIGNTRDFIDIEAKLIDRENIFRHQQNLLIFVFFIAVVNHKQ